MKKRTKIIISLSVIIAIVIVGIIGYNLVGDYAIDFMLKISAQNLIEQNEKDFKLQSDKIIKDYEDQLKKLELLKNLSEKEKKKREEILKAERNKKLQKIQDSRVASQKVSKIKIPDDIKKQMLALAIKGLGADGVSKCLAMLSGGLSAEEKTLIKELFRTKFSAEEQKQILEWASKYYK